MDRNTILGFILMAVVLFGFSYLNKPSQEQLDAQKRYRDSIELVNTQQLIAQEVAATAAADRAMLEAAAGETPNDSTQNAHLAALYGQFAGAATGDEKLITLENDLLQIQVSTKGGRIYSALLKNYKDHEKNPLVLFEGEESDFNTTLVTSNNRIVDTRGLYFRVKESSDRSVTLTLSAGGDASLDFVYSLHQDDYMVDFNVVPHNLGNVLSPSFNTLDIVWSQKIRQQERGRTFEERYARLSYKYSSDDVEQLSESKDERKELSNRIKWIGFKDQFFSSVLIAQDNFEATALSSKVYKSGRYIKDYSATTSVEFEPRMEKPVAMNFFFVPNDYKMLKNYDKTKFEGQDLQLEKLVPLGWWLFRGVNKYIIIPIFDVLNSWVGNAGIAILLLTLIVKLVLFPLMYKSLISSAKMRVLKPQIDAINEKHPGQDKAMVRQQKTMELYNQVGINPMAGCMPMLLQMPILFALFMFFPSAIELRQQSFLWADDLSTYDALIHWDAYIPILSQYFGNHISIFCLLMSLVTIINTKYTMEQQGASSQQMPGMKFMMYSMPVFMFFILNSYPAGLNLYYLVSTVITILLTLAFRMTINDEKVLAKLEKNKANPKKKKKSGFMQRLEEAQRQQQALLKEQQKKNNKKK